MEADCTFFCIGHQEDEMLRYPVHISRVAMRYLHG